MGSYTPVIYYYTVNDKQNEMNINISGGIVLDLPSKLSILQ